MPDDTRPLLRIGHSPDPDDAFMWHPLTGRDGRGPAVDTGRFRFEAVAEDIETLNERSESGDLEITAVSVAQVPRIADRYALTACGASMGSGYGPKIVAREPLEPEAILERDLVLAVPGTRTSAFLATGLLLGGRSFAFQARPFDEIIPAVRSGEFEAGVVIHEGQLTYDREGLHLVADLGAWWTERTGLPLPLGGNVIRLDLESIHGPGTLAEVTATLRRSLDHALAHRQESLDHALGYARGLERDLADRFVAMYVNEHTLDFGPTGREAVRRFLGEAESAGLVTARDEVRFVDPAGVGPEG